MHAVLFTAYLDSYLRCPIKILMYPASILQYGKLQKIYEFEFRFTDRS